MKKREFIFGLSTGLSIAHRALAGSSETPFFEGETIKWIIPYRPGGGYDEYSRLIAPFMEAHTGANIDLLNLPGGGGMRGAAELFRSPADGLHIGLINGGGLLASSLVAPLPDGWDFARYSFLGRVASEPRVMIVNANGPYVDYSSLVNSGRTVIFGATGIGGSTYVDSVLAGRILELDQRVVHGFDNSADIRLALLRGDVDGMWGSLGSAYDGLVSGDFRPVLTVAPAADPVLSDTPDIEAAKSDALRDPERRALFEAWLALSEIGRPVAGPPGIPADRLALLREALANTLADPVLLSAAKAANRRLSALSGEEAEQIAARFAKTDAHTLAIISAAVRGEI